ncbi:MAG: DUF2975 domain-containing protein [Sphingomonadales bacterium]
MQQSHPSVLSLSRLVLRALVLINFAVGAFIVAMLVASFAAGDRFFFMLGARVDANPALVPAMRLIMVIGIGGVPIAHVLLTRLLAIVETVRIGDPFVPPNAARLQTIAWALLGLELLHLAVGAVAAAASTKAAPLDIGWSLSVTDWLAILLLFVLARVFDQGTRMREDLEGTV